MSALPSLETLLQQEAEHRLPQFDFDLAWQIGQGIQQRGREMNAPIAIEVYAFGQVLFLAALPGSAPENLEGCVVTQHGAVDRPLFDVCRVR
ncbi:heme-binding protein (plasmid) [Pseudomonas silvicola]|nr:heme-binding protein [Pseudomonas silvicola]